MGTQCIGPKDSEDDPHGTGIEKRAEEITPNSKAKHNPRLEKPQESFRVKKQDQQGCGWDKINLRRRSYDIWAGVEGLRGEKEEL